MSNALFIFRVTVVLSCCSWAGAVWMRLPVIGSKCVSEEIKANVVILADYTAAYENDESQSTAFISCKATSAHPAVTEVVVGVATLVCARNVVLSDPLEKIADPTHGMWGNDFFKVTSPYGNVLYHQENVTNGQFAMTTTESGNYLACFTLVSMKKEAIPSVNINWRIGIAAKDWDFVAKKEKIEGVELELRKLEGAVEAIHDNLLYLKNREAEMWVVSEKTNSRIASYSVMSLGICIIVSVLQVCHLQSFFEKKKLI